MNLWKVLTHCWTKVPFVLYQILVWKISIFALTALRSTKYFWKIWIMKFKDEDWNRSGLFICKLFSLCNSTSLLSVEGRMKFGKFGMEFISTTNAHRSISVCQRVKNIVHSFVLKHFILSKDLFLLLRKADYSWAEKRRCCNGSKIDLAQSHKEWLIFHHLHNNQFASQRRHKIP